MLMKILICGLDTSTTVPYNSYATPDVLDIIITKDPVTIMYLTTCCPDLRTDWPKLQASLEDGLRSDPDIPNEVAIEACVLKLSCAILK
jgi:hypothetical protein